MKRITAVVAGLVLVAGATAHSPCTFAACNWHAIAVTGPAGDCRCSCRNMWSGRACENCPSVYDATKDCGACAPGFTGYPQCYSAPQTAEPSTKAASRQCTINADCNGHAVSVSGTAGNCQCTCRNMWAGATCDMCYSQYDASKDCGACHQGFTGYPQCYSAPQTAEPSTKAASRQCTINADCNGHAVSVSGTAGNCQCTCRNMWVGASCATCPSNYAVAQDCGACHQGFTGYPDCQSVEQQSAARDASTPASESLWRNTYFLAGAAAALVCLGVAVGIILGVRRASGGRTRYQDTVIALGTPLGNDEVEAAPKAKHDV